MKCPSCKNSDLKPTRIDEGLSALGCSQCGGAYISLLYYRDWVERHPSAETETVELEKDSLQSETHSSLNCPKCGRIMTKYQIYGSVGNRLDLCSSCDEAWLDNGEWSLLKALELSHKLPAVFTDDWQLRVRREVNEIQRKERYLKLLGEDELRQAEEFRKWIDNHPKRQTILEYVRHE